MKFRCINHNPYGSKQVLFGRQEAGKYCYRPVIKTSLGCLYILLSDLTSLRRQRWFFYELEAFCVYNNGWKQRWARSAQNDNTPCQHALTNLINVPLLISMCPKDLRWHSLRACLNAVCIQRTLHDNNWAELRLIACSLVTTWYSSRTTGRSSSCIKFYLFQLVALHNTHGISRNATVLKTYLGYIFLPAGRHVPCRFPKAAREHYESATTTNLLRRQANCDSEMQAVAYLICGVVRLRGNGSFLPTHRSRLWHSKLEVRRQVHGKFPLLAWWKTWNVGYCRSCPSPRNWAGHLKDESKKQCNEWHLNSTHKSKATGTHQFEGRNNLHMSGVAIAIFHTFVRSCSSHQNWTRHLEDIKQGGAVNEAMQRMTSQQHTHKIKTTRTNSRAGITCI